MRHLTDRRRAAGGHLRRRLIVVTVSLALAGCSAESGSESIETNALRTASSVAATTTAPSAGLPVSASEGPTSIEALPPTPASPASAEVLPGEAWILSAWYLPGRNTKNLFLVRPDGTDSHVIFADLPGEHTAAAWSPDGSQFAFTDRDAATPDGSIWTANADGSGARLLTDGGGECPDGTFHPSWSPDGSRLSVICYPDPGGQEGSVATFDLTTRQVTRLYTVKLPEHLDGPAKWSPDGASLAFTIYHWDPTGQFVDGSLVAVIPAAGGTVRRLTKFAEDMTEGSWSPDGSEIAIAKNDVGMRHSSDHASNVYAIAPDGTGLRQITRSSVDGYMRIFAPEWLPDGRMLVKVGVAPHKAGVEPTVNDLQLGFVNPSGGEPALLPPTIHGGTLRPTPKH